MSTQLLYTHNKGRNDITTHIDITESDNYKCANDIMLYREASPMCCARKLGFKMLRGGRQTKKQETKYKQAVLQKASAFSPFRRRREKIQTALILDCARHYHTPKSSTKMTTKHFLRQPTTKNKKRDIDNGHLGVLRCTRSLVSSWFLPSSIQKQGRLQVYPNDAVVIRRQNHAPAVTPSLRRFFGQLPEYRLQERARRRLGHETGRGQNARGLRRRRRKGLVRAVRGFLSRRQRGRGGLGQHAGRLGQRRGG